MTIRAPIYLLTVENPLDSVLRDSEGRPVLDSNGRTQSTIVNTAVSETCS